MAVLDNPGIKFAIEEALEIIVEFISDLMSDIQSGMSIGDSLKDAAGKTKSTVKEDVKFTTAIVSTSYLADAVKPGTEKIIRNSIDELKTMWDTVDDLLNDSSVLSWENVLTDSLTDISLNYLEKSINKDLVKDGISKELLTFAKSDSLLIESMSGTTVKLLPEIYELMSA